ncbi:hypothetical protein DJ90_4788 [Paenibacillus macerans]|uniref:Uncharacterized protein n=1 Tax=Paenibacillus macerans TaxID=44252 RepID=A0A090Y6I1_PAEMA|nr:hypothetical protein DJ90_4788 [Paenibacillus macerans]
MGMMFADLCSFNPRTHMECDDRLASCQIKLLNFQSTHSHGVRLYAFCVFGFRQRFQSTHSHGVRLDGIVRSSSAFEISFNPRTHMECDARPRYRRRSVFALSIHALTWSATDVGKAFDKRRDLSIHALTWSATVRPSATGSLS